MTEITLTPQEVISQATEEARGLATVAKGVVVKTPEEYRAAGAGFAEVKAKRKELETRRLSITGPINQSLKLINEGFRAADAELERAQRFYEEPMLAFQRAEEEARREAERKAAEERRRIEQEAREKAAEEARQAKEALERAEALRAQASASEDPLAAILAQDEADAAEREGADAISRSEAELRAAAMTTVVADAPARTTSAGSRVLMPWKHEVIDASKVPDQFKVVDEKALGAYARAMKDKAAVPGVRFFQDMKIGGA